MISIMTVTWYWLVQHHVYSVCRAVGQVSEPRVHATLVQMDVGTEPALR